MKKSFLLLLIFAAAFLLFTCLAVTVDRGSFTPQPAGEAAEALAAGETAAETVGQETAVGFSALNFRVQEKLGYRNSFYKASKYLGYLAILSGCALLAWTCLQALRRRSLFRVDSDLKAASVMIVCLAVCYILFEKLALNMRPVIIDLHEGLEASYPSTHTLLGCCLFGGAAVFVLRRFAGKPFAKPAAALLVLCAAATVACRLLSGVHWLTDIIGGLLLSACLVSLMCAVRDRIDARKAL